MKQYASRASCVMKAAFIACVCLCGAQSTEAQNFDFKRLDAKVRSFSVIIDLTVEISFGMQSTEEKQELLGTVVSADGLVIFNGAVLSSDNLFSNLSGVTVKTTPLEIRVRTLDGRTYQGEYLGADRFSRIGFIQIQDAEKGSFSPVVFSDSRMLSVGRWVALYKLLPDFVKPPLAGDVGMVSAVIESPESFPMLIGFSGEEVTSVVFDESYAPVGVLGTMIDPTSASQDAGGMLESFDNGEAPLLGVVTGERLKRILSTPPKKGTSDRGWLGITLQALTKDLAEYWSLPIVGGIIVSDVLDGSPGEAAGLKVSDVLFRVNGGMIPVDREENIALFQRTIAEMGPGATVQFSLYRKSGLRFDSLALPVTLVRAPLAASDASEYHDSLLEYSARDLVFGDFSVRGIEQGAVNGVVVSKLEQGGPAAIGGLLIGDIIQRVGSTSIASVAELESAVASMRATSPREVIFFVWRDGGTLFVNVKPK